MYSSQELRVPQNLDPQIRHFNTLSASVHAVFNCVQLFAIPWTVSPTGSSVHGIFQARILEQVAISYPRGFSQPRDQTCVSCVYCIGRWILYLLATREAKA